MDAAGANVEVVHGDGVTFAYRADALVVIVGAGDRPHGNAVDDANTQVLREPLGDRALVLAGGVLAVVADLGVEPVV